nr:MAG TPA: hypothetical protein [Caudoviricetes sp.]
MAWPSPIAPTINNRFERGDSMSIELSLYPIGRRNLLLSY